MKYQPDGGEKEEQEKREREHVPHTHVTVHVKCVDLRSLACSSVCVHQTE